MGISFYIFKNKIYNSNYLNYKFHCSKYNLKMYSLSDNNNETNRGGARRHPIYK